MPKVIDYIESEWAIKKICDYCGKEFYPESDEFFCNWICEENYADYIDWYEQMLLDDLIKSEESDYE